MITEFKTLGEMHHMISAHFDYFPILKVKHLPVVFTEIMTIFTAE